MPLGRKHLRRSRDAPTGGIGLERSTSSLGRNPAEVKYLLDVRAGMGVAGGTTIDLGRGMIPA